MKKLNYILLILFVLTGNSCKNFLQEDLQGTFSSSTFYKTEQDLILALTGVYNSASFSNTNNELWVFGDVASDDAAKGGQPGDLADAQFIKQFTYARTNTILENMWRYYYEGISRANYLIYYGQGIDMSASSKARIIGQAKFLRAYFYFNLTNIYGEIPLKLLPPLTLNEINVPKSTVVAVYAQIEADLLDAAHSLPASYSLGDAGRATKGAAYGLLAKARLYNSDWAGALSAIDSLEAFGSYSLVPVYKNNFLDSTQNNAESVFEIQHLRGQSPLLSSFLNQYFSPSIYNGYYFDQPLQNFVDEFEKTPDETADPRLDATVGREGQPWVNGEAFDPSWSSTGYLQKKNVQSLHAAPIIGDAGLNYVYMRYADVLLMKAEALNELSRGAEALVPLNAVRSRARASYTGSTPEPLLLPAVTLASQATLRDAIRHERRVELGFEFHRYFDLIRYGKDAAEAALGIYGFVYSKNHYFQIPQSELDTNPAITN